MKTRQKRLKKLSRYLPLGTATLIALFPLLSVSSNAHASTTATSTSSTSQVQPWSIGITYNPGDLVTYQGQTYQCTESTLSLEGWQPPNVPAVWEPITSTTPFAEGPMGGISGKYQVIGYYPDWATYGAGYQVSNAGLPTSAVYNNSSINPNQFTVINYAFATICWNGKYGNPTVKTWSCDQKGVPLQQGNVPNGSIVLGDPWADTQQIFNGTFTWTQSGVAKAGNFGAIQLLKKQDPNLRVDISVGGWTWSNQLSDMAATAQTRDNFANSVVKFLEYYGLDGIDIDWEYPGGGGLTGNDSNVNDAQNFTLLLQDLRQKLDAAGLKDGKYYTLSIAAGANPDYLKLIQPQQVAKTVNWIDLMTYDYNGNWSNVADMNAPLYADPNDPQSSAPIFNINSTVNAYLNAGFSPKELILGEPFYGYGWSGCPPINHGLYQICTGSIPKGTWDTGTSGYTGVFDYGDLIANYVNKNGFTRYWNPTTMTPYLYNQSNGEFISYDDQQSIAAKDAYVKSNGLGGAMIWDISTDAHNGPAYSSAGAPSLLAQIDSDFAVQ